MLTEAHHNSVPLNDFAASASQNAVLRAFGAPSHELLSEMLLREPALIALHLGATLYKIAVVIEVLNHYSSDTGLPVEQHPVLSLLLTTLEGNNARAQAAMLYQHATDLDPKLAEAYYGQARLAQAILNYEAAIKGFETALRLSPHIRAPAHAMLQANAYWECATILERQGRDEAALKTYRAAIARLETFGVDHIRLARFLRRLGHFEEAAVHYRRCMVYSHRYFPEFILPPLVTDAPPVQLPVEVIYNTQRGEPVIFWNGNYLALSAQQGPFEFANIKQFERRLSGGPRYRSATSIASLEDEIH